MNARWPVILGMLAVVPGLAAQTAGPATDAKAKSQSQAKPKPKPKPRDPRALDKTPPPDDEGEDLRPFTLSTEGAIRMLEGRLKDDPNDVASRLMLGEMHVRHAHEAGDLAGFERAEACFRAVQKARPTDRRAQLMLAMVLCDRHKFAEAMAMARRVAAKNPKNIDAMATIADANLELGRYDEAEAGCKALMKLTPEPPVMARVARLAELRGKTDEAIALLRRAGDEERLAGAREGSLWYRVRVGDILFDAGRLDEAEKAIAGVLAESPDHHDATYSLGRIRAAQGRLSEAIALEEKAVGIAAEPPMLGLLGDLYQKAGRDADARATFDRLEALTAKHDEYRRERAIYYLNHDVKLAEALALARKDVADRGDIFGHDTLAWALLKNGQAAEAAAEIDKALKLGTRDAKLYYHAGMIHARLGDTAKARDFLARALALNPHFSALQADDARKTLDSLGGPEKAG
ncbi:MAG TPA: tetratricopeptide repeat protein [Isosphaeraceae bacterium]|jgi:tetratricopeptide (TPR) repeat protein|nr:tetratricopeptide repeat protein [Isosphaeraceae bacterium]